MERRALLASALALTGGRARAGAREPVSGAPGPRRIVSLNPCLDAILVPLADRAQVVAVSHYSHDPSSSSLGEAARGLPFTWGSAEEVMALAPDLVLADRFTAPATRAAFAQLHLRVEVFDSPDSVAASLAQVRRIGALVQRPARAEALVARIEAALAQAAPPPGARRLSALVFQTGGFAAAKGTLVDELLTHCGFDNAAPRYGLKRTGAVPLERLVVDPPEVLLAGEARTGAPTWADRVVRHPALARVAARMHRANFPQRLTFCGGPVIIEAAAMLARARHDALERHG